MNTQVPAEYQVIVTALRELVQSFVANAGAHAGRKREADDNSKKVGALFWRMNAGELKPEVLDKLRALVSAIQSGNAQEAASIQVRLCLIFPWRTLPVQCHPGCRWLSGESNACLVSPHQSPRCFSTLMPGLPVCR